MPVPAREQNPLTETNQVNKQQLNAHVTFARKIGRGFAALEVKGATLSKELYERFSGLTLEEFDAVATAIKAKAKATNLRDALGGSRPANVMSEIRGIIKAGIKEPTREKALEALDKVKGTSQSNKTRAVQKASQKPAPKSPAQKEAEKPSPVESVDTTGLPEVLKELFVAYMKADIPLRVEIAPLLVDATKMLKGEPLDGEEEEPIQDAA